jgi:multiple sugar transport system substrate-binding protein
MSRLTMIPSITRRNMLRGAGATAATPLIASLARSALAQSGEAINFTAWSAAVDQAKSHVSGFEKATGLKVNYENFPAAQFRATLVTKFTGGEPLDVIFMNDAWTPEFAEAGWIVPIDDVPALMKYNSDIETYCVNAMTYKGRQYGLVYYADHMAFMYNADILQKAGIAAPPTSWDEVVQQSLKIKQAGLSDYPLLLSLAADAWLIEMIGAIMYSYGGRFTDDKGFSVLADPKNGALAAARWITDAIQVHKIVSPGAVTTNEIDGLKAFGTGSAAFGLVPRYRIRSLNDPAQSQVPGKVRIALMPQGSGTGSGHHTCGWVRYYGITPHARADKTREATALKLVEWFGGKANNDYVFQKMLMLDLGVPFCTAPLKQDKDVLAFFDKWVGGADVVNKQATLAVTKDVITPWFGEWNETNNQAWQAIFLAKATPEAGLKTSADKWNQLKQQF